MELPPSVLKSLADARYDRRKAAALEIENLTRKLVFAQQHDRIHMIIGRLGGSEFALSPESNHRKGGLIGLAALAVGLGPTHLDRQTLSLVLPPILRSFLDQDPRVRYSACESLYNVLKIARTKLLPFFLAVFDGLVRLVADPDPNVQNAANLLSNLLKDVVAESGPETDRLDLPAVILDLQDKMRAINPFVRQFLVSWVALLDSVPDSGLLRHLDAILGPLLEFLSDNQREVRAATETLLEDLVAELREDVPASSPARTLDFSAAAAPDLPPPSRAPACDVAALTALLIACAKAPRPNIETLYTCQFLEACVDVAPHAALQSNFKDVLQLVLRCVGSPDPQIRPLAVRLNSKMRASAEGAMDPAGSGSNVSSSPGASKGAGSRGTLSPADLPAIFEVLEVELRSPEEGTRLEALYWVRCIIRLYATDTQQHAEGRPDPSSLASHISGLVVSMTEALFASDPRVVAVAGDILEGLAVKRSNFDRILSGLVSLFRTPRGPPNAALMASKGVGVLRDLMGRLGAEAVLVRLAEIVELETSSSAPSAPLSSHQDRLRQASFWAQSLNWLVLTAPELESLRTSLKQWNDGRRPLVQALFPLFAHSVSASLSLCLLAGYTHVALRLLQSFETIDPSPSALAQLDRLVRMLESPPFTFLRLALAIPRSPPGHATPASLYLTLLALRAVLPQKSEAFGLMDARLRDLAPWSHDAASKLPAGKAESGADYDRWVALFREALRLHSKLDEASEDGLANGPNSFHR